MKICSVEGCGLKHFAKGFCNKHYYKQYYKENLGSRNRKKFHSFNDYDETRFLSIVKCDWCGFLFKEGQIPHIDHDRRCCNSAQHCYKCTRGFVHKYCNIMAIGYYEKMEREHGFVDPKLSEYRIKFPVPR
jgi:hypothetical protein